MEGMKEQLDIEKQKQKQKMKKIRQEHEEALKNMERQNKIDSNVLSQNAIEEANSIKKQAQEIQEELERNNEQLKVEVEMLKKANEESKKKLGDSTEAIINAGSLIESCSKLIRTITSANGQLGNESVRTTISTLIKKSKNLEDYFEWNNDLSEPNLLLGEDCRKFNKKFADESKTDRKSVV